MRPSRTCSCVILPVVTCLWAMIGAGACSDSVASSPLHEAPENDMAGPSGRATSGRSGATGVPAVEGQVDAAQSSGAKEREAGVPNGGRSGSDTGGVSTSGSTGSNDAGRGTSGETDFGGAPPVRIDAAVPDSKDPLEILRAYAPKDVELAEAYEEYITTEVGPLSYATEGAGGERTIKQTIFVPPNAVYDGKGEKLTADVAAMKCDVSKGEQAESQRPFFLLAPGASVKNVTIAYPGCEGIHMMGDNVLENVTWDDVGEDAASVRSYFPGGTILIKGARARMAADKMFQFNAPCAVRIEDFEGDDMGKLVRQNGGTGFELSIDLYDVKVTGVISAVVQSDSPLCYVKHHNLTYQFKGSGDKSDRVFKDVPPANVTEY